MALNFFLGIIGIVKTSYALTLFFMFLFYAVGFFITWLFRVRKVGWSALGLSGFSFPAFIWGSAAFFLFLLFSNFYGYLLGLMGYELDRAYSFARFFSQAKGFWLIPTFLLVSFLGPLTEEIFFRGYLYLYLKEKNGLRVALLSSSLIFGFLHFSLLLVLPFVFFGFLSALMLEKRGSLDASLIFHILNNALALLYFLYVI